MPPLDIGKPRIDSLMCKCGELLTLAAVTALGAYGNETQPIINLDKERLLNAKLAMRARAIHPLSLFTRVSSSMMISTTTISKVKMREILGWLSSPWQPLPLSFVPKDLDLSRSSLDFARRRRRRKLFNLEDYNFLFFYPITTFDSSA